MSNLDKPVLPVYHNNYAVTLGLTAREHACIQLRVPKSGDPELDSLIREAVRRELAGEAMASCRSRGSNYASWADLTSDAVDMADALLAALEESQYER